MVDALNGEAGGSGLRSLIGGNGWPGEVSTLAVDTDRGTLEGLTHTHQEDRMHLPVDPRDRDDGKRHFRELGGRIVDEVGERGKCDLIIMFVGGGGSTGSSFAPLLADRLAGVMEGAIYCVLALPYQSEGEAGRRTAETLKELFESSAGNVLLVDNSYLASRETSEAFPEINERVASAVYRLLSAVESPMMTVADLGDLKSTLSSGNEIGTVGMVENLDAPVDQAIKRSLGREGALMPVDIYNEGSRAFIVIEGPEERLETEALTRELGNLTKQLFNVFKGLIIDDEQKGIDVLSAVSLNRSRRLEEYLSAVSSTSSIELKEVEEF